MLDIDFAVGDEDAATAAGIVELVYFVIVVVMLEYVLVEPGLAEIETCVEQTVVGAVCSDVAAFVVFAVEMAVLVLVKLVYVVIVLDVVDVAAVIAALKTVVFVDLTVVVFELDFAEPAI